MNKAEFKARWESDDTGGGVTFDDVAECAKKWGLFARPRTARINDVLYAVLVAAKVEDAEEYKVAENAK